jgi:hypothetical protein
MARICCSRGVPEDVVEEIGDEALWMLKKNFRTAAWLFAASGNGGGQPHRCQFVADFTGNWPGVPRSPDPLGRWSNPWRVPQPLPAGEECLGAGPDGTG